MLKLKVHTLQSSPDNKYTKFLQQPIKIEVRSCFTLHLMISYFYTCVFLKIIITVKIANQKVQCKTSVFVGCCKNFEQISNLHVILQWFSWTCIIFQSTIFSSVYCHTWFTLQIFSLVWGLLRLSPKNNTLRSKYSSYAIIYISTTMHTIIIIMKLLCSRFFT